MVRIITDSAADFEPFELEKLNIFCIPLKVMLGGTEYEENVNLSKDQFFSLLASTGDTPKTSQPSPQILIDLYQDALKAGEESIYITLSSILQVLRTAHKVLQEFHISNVFQEHSFYELSLHIRHFCIYTHLCRNAFFQYPELPFHFHLLFL